MGNSVATALPYRCRCRVRKFDATAGSLDAAALTALSDDLVAVARLLLSEVNLARHLAEPADNPAPKVALLDAVLSGRVGATALELLRSAVSSRWSEQSDLVDAIEHIARLALIKRTEIRGEVAEVEDQLFRFSRVLDAQPRLSTLLGDYGTPIDGRVALLDNVLTGAHGSVNSTVKALLTQIVSLLRGERADQAVLDLAELAVGRRRRRLGLGLGLRGLGVGIRRAPEHGPRPAIGRLAQGILLGRAANHENDRQHRQSRTQQVVVAMPWRIAPL